MRQSVVFDRRIHFADADRYVSGSQHAIKCHGCLPLWRRAGDRGTANRARLKSSTDKPFCNPPDVAVELTAAAQGPQQRVSQHRGPRLGVLVDDGYPNFGESAIERRCISPIKRWTCGFGKVAIDAALEMCQAPEKL